MKAHFATGLLCALVIFLNPHVTRAQVQVPHKLTINFLKPEITITDNLWKVKRGDYYQIVIKNLNPNLYTITLVATDTLIYPAVELPVFGAFGLPGLSDLLPGAGSVFPIDKNEEIKNGLNIGAIQTQSGLQRAVEISFDSLGNQQRHFNKLIVRAESIIGEMGDKLMSVYDRKETFANSVPAKTYSENLRKLKGEVVSLENRVADQQLILNQEALTVKTKADSTLLASAPYRVLLQKQQALLLQVGILSDTLSSSSMREMLRAVARINTDRKFTSLPIQFTGDQTRIKLVIQPRLKDANVHTYATEFEFPTYLRNYTRVGPSFYLSGLYDQKFSSVSTGQNTGELPVWDEEDNQRFEMGLAVMLRHGWRISQSDVGFHVAFGPGVSYTDKVRGRLLIGPGFTFGKQHAISLDFGLIAGNVQRLSTVFEDSQVISNATDPTVSKTEIRPYLALGYVFRL